MLPVHSQSSRHRVLLLFPSSKVFIKQAPTYACHSAEQGLETQGGCGPALWEFHNLTQTSERLIEIKNTQTMGHR